MDRINDLGRLYLPMLYCWIDANGGIICGPVVGAITKLRLIEDPGHRTKGFWNKRTKVSEVCPFTWPDVTLDLC